MEKKNQMKVETINEIFKNSDRLNDRLEMTEGRISKLEARAKKNYTIWKPGKSIIFITWEDTVKDIHREKQWH